MKKVILFLLVAFNSSNGTQLTIAQPGVYQLGSNLTLTPTASNDQIIRISSSGVVLDFNGHFISQLNTTTGIDGILIDSNLSDVTIQNGVVRQVTGNGLSISSTTTNITITNMTFETCGTTAITGTVVKNLYIKDVYCVGCCSNSTSTNVVLLTSVSNGSIKNCVIDNTINTSPGTFSGMLINGCNACNFESVTIQNCSAAGTAFNGLNDQICVGCQFFDVNVKFNQASGNFNGLSTTSTYGIYTDCSCVANTAGGLFNGFVIQPNASLCVLQRCLVNNNINNGVTGSGFLISGFSCTLIDCISSHLFNPSRNTASAGFLLQSGGAANTLLNCIGTQQSDNTVYGMFVNSTQRHAVLGGILMRDVGASDPTSFGVLEVSGIQNLYVRLVAYNNGQTQTQQLFNVAAGSVNTIPAVQTSNINSATLPWSSVPVAN
ncbi:hypothetical protein HYX58_05990 [Candidatus Dependentiae bacterium]|nr:hypothetical protein [Candidatus Dependentiae bacterium]